MIDERERLGRVVTGFAPPEDAFERLVNRRGRKQRNQRIRAGALGIVIALAMGIVLVRSLSSDGIPADEPTPAPSVSSGALMYLVGNRIYVADPDGSNALKIADGAAGDGCTGTGAFWSNEFPAWSPDGRYIAFLHTCSGTVQQSTSEVMIIDPLGNVVAEFPKGLWGFAWSPDSTHIAVWGEDPNRSVDVYGIDGERDVSLRFPSRMAPHNDTDPAWMPDGSAIFLNGQSSGRFAVPLDGSAPYDLGLGGVATYSPDGTRVAVATDDVIRILDADGSLVSQVPVSELHGVEDIEAWSPDGEWLASVSLRGDLNIIDAASGAITTLTEATAALNPGTRINIAEGFSPEGDRILYSVGRGADADTALWSIGVDGSDPRLLVEGSMQGQWRPR